jgi:Cdc6-like AAA superfamily ATPase
MELFNTSANEPVQEINIIKPQSELIIDQIPTLPLHFKLVLYSRVSLIGQNKKNMKAALTDVFIEYRRLADEVNIDWLSMKRINEIAKELEMLGFLACSYIHKRDGRVRYLRFHEPAQIPR